MMLPQELRPPQVTWVWVHEDEVKQFQLDNPTAAYCDFESNRDGTMSALFKVVNGA